MRQYADLAKKLSFEAPQVQDYLLSQIGNTGTEGAFIMLVAALKEVNPGDRILFAN